MGWGDLKATWLLRAYTLVKIPLVAWLWPVVLQKQRVP